ncbi:hypothetical protein SGLAM104S_09894 [Streptomyces glaucescens]
MTDYEGEVKIRMNTENYGDVLLIPASVAKGDYPKFFAPLGATPTMKETYRFTDKTDVDGRTYGIATFGTANGFVYNKALWKRAGITDWPTSAPGVPRRPGGDQGEDGGHPVLHQLQGRLAAQQPVDQQHRLGQLRQPGLRQALRGREARGRRAPISM